MCTTVRTMASTAQIAKLCNHTVLLIYSYAHERRDLPPAQVKKYWYNLSVREYSLKSEVAPSRKQLPDKEICVHSITKFLLNVNI